MQTSPQLCEVKFVHALVLFIYVTPVCRFQYKKALIELYYDLGLLNCFFKTAQLVTTLTISTFIKRIHLFLLRLFFILCQAGSHKVVELGIFIMSIIIISIIELQQYTEYSELRYTGLRQKDQERIKTFKKKKKSRDVSKTLYKNKTQDTKKKFSLKDKESLCTTISISNDSFHF